MLYEYRRYTAAPGRMPDVHARFAGTVLELFTRHGIDPVGFWQPVVGAPGTELHYLLRWADADAQERGWSAFLADPDWQRVRRESERDGPLLSRIDNQLWRPTSWSERS
jgi:hypothetical protein